MRGRNGAKPVPTRLRRCERQPERGAKAGILGAKRVRPKARSLPEEAPSVVKFEPTTNVSRRDNVTDRSDYERVTNVTA